MLAQPKTVVLIREAIKLAFLWASWVSGASAFVGSIILSKWPEKRELSSQIWQSILVLTNEGYSMWEIAKKVKFYFNGVYYSRQRTAQTGSNQIRKRSGRPRCTTKQEDKYIRVSSLRNRRLTSPQLAASWNGTRKTPVSTSTVKRRFRDAGLLGRVAKKKPYPRLANKRKRLRWAKEHRHWTEEDWKKCYGQTNLSLRCLDHIWNICEMQNKWKDAWRHLSSMVEVMWWSGAALVLVKWEICTK